MRIRVDYTTAYDYAELAHHVVQLLRVEPSVHDGQHVVSWRIDVDCDGHLRRGRDSFGNVVHMFYADAPLRALTLHVSGEVDTSETHGLISGSEDSLPLAIWRRDTPLTMADAAIGSFARAHRGDGALATCHALAGAIQARVNFDTDATGAHTDAAHAFALAAGVCQDQTHIFLAAARHLEIPARYVSGHLVRSDGMVTQPAAHAWAEAWIDNLGWVGFDPTNGVSPTEAYLRVAVGLDYLDAAPVRGTRRGGGVETMSVSVTTRDLAPAQTRSQSQSQGQVQA
jgi:transglutaminase-like putative cysteine protease